MARAYEVASVFLKDQLGPEEKDKESVDTVMHKPYAARKNYVTDIHQLSGSYYGPELNATYQLKIEPKGEKIILYDAQRNTSVLHVLNLYELSNNTYKIIFNTNFQTFNMNYAGTRGIIFQKIANLAANE
ncbi:hypothetical protein OKW21_003377 [Catalinimonas alkaloidigena]|uniref:hypothetical protein n=1 Tax=Catalinimonas alkaloidigena TaxID=1075417 RepID=UPI002404BC52|nr:hypothetical protein [Catalinimonas alkaloidigena]MDF9798114.1 hypothetical protein [Catalinimonas alkaloidigena]